MITSLRLTSKQEVAELTRALRAQHRALYRISYALRDPYAATRLVTVTRLINRLEREVEHATD